jgi:hypothetical protein
VPGSSNVAPPDGPPRTIEVRLHRRGNVAAPENLPPTDVMFENGHAFHNAFGKGAVDHAAAHADPQTVVALRRAKDRVVWVADEPFAVVRIRWRGHIPGHPETGPDHGPMGQDNPFDFVLPRCSGAQHRVDAGPPKDTAETGRYKVTFAIGNELVDPDLEIFP